MKNRSLSYWLLVTGRNLTWILIGSLIYALIMGKTQLYGSSMGTGMRMLQNLLAEGFHYFCLMSFVFLGRFALDGVQRQIPLCISHGETRRDVMINQQVSVFLQLVITVAVIAVIMFVLIPGSSCECRYADFIAHPLWTMSIIAAYCLLSLSVSQLGGNLMIQTDGRFAVWSTFGTLIVSIIVASVTAVVAINLIENLFGNAVIATVALGFSVLLYVIGFFWMKHLMKNYRVSI